MRAAPPAWAAALLLAALMPFRLPAQDVVITLEQKEEETIKLGFVDFGIAKGDAGAAKLSPGEVVRGDLDYSGRFELYHSSTFDEAARSYFRENGALAYVRGHLALDGGRFLLEAELIDVSTGEPIVGKKYSGEKSALRDSAHSFSDELVYQLFGEKGIARTRLAYVSSRSGNKEIYLMDYDGAGFTQLTNNKSINLFPCWVEDNGGLLFTSYAGGTPQFHLLKLALGSNSAYMPSGGMKTAPAYNRIDREIAYAYTLSGNSEIYRVPVEGGKPVRLTYSGAIDTSPSWSPNGYEIAFISDRSGRPMLYVMDRDGSNVRRLTFEGKYHGSPSWSPKGDLIAFSSLEGSHMDIYTISPDGKDLRRLTEGAGSNEYPSFSPDGRHIAFSSTRTGSAEIWVMRADGSHARRLSFSGKNSMPRWSDY